MTPTTGGPRWAIPQTHVLAQFTMRDVEVEDADLGVELTLTPDLANPLGSLQGGMVATLADIVAGRLALSGVVDDEAVTTTDLTVHYLAPLVAGPARAEGCVLRRGRRHVVIRVDITDVGAERLAAVATVAFAVVPRRPA